MEYDLKRKKYSQNIHIKLNPALVFGFLNMCLAVWLHQANQDVLDIFRRSGAYFADCFYLIYSRLKKHLSTVVIS